MSTFFLKHRTPNCPAKHGSDRHETLPKCVSDNSQHLILRRSKKIWMKLSDWKWSITSKIARFRFGGATNFWALLANFKSVRFFQRVQNRFLIFFFRSWGWGLLKGLIGGLGPCQSFKGLFKGFSTVVFPNFWTLGSGIAGFWPEHRIPRQKLYICQLGGLFGSLKGL